MSDETASDGVPGGDETADEGDLGDAASKKGGGWTDPYGQP